MGKDKSKKSRLKRWSVAAGKWLVDWKYLQKTGERLPNPNEKLGFDMEDAQSYVRHRKPASSWKKILLLIILSLVGGYFVALSIKGLIAAATVWGALVGIIHGTVAIVILLLVVVGVWIQETGSIPRVAQKPIMQVARYGLKTLGRITQDKDCYAEQAATVERLVLSASERKLGDS